MIAKNVKWDNAAATLDNAAHLRIWKTNFPYQIHEKVRRYVYDSSPRRPDFQLVLSDRERSPEEKIQSGAPDAKTPAMKQYSAGSEYSKMYDIIRENVVYDLSRVFYKVICNGAIDSNYQDAVSGKLSMAWTTKMRTAKISIEKDIKKIQTLFDSFK